MTALEAIELEPEGGVTAVGDYLLVDNVSNKSYIYLRIFCTVVIFYLFVYQVLGCLLNCVFIYLVDFSNKVSCEFVEFGVDSRPCKLRTTPVALF